MTAYAVINIFPYDDLQYTPKIFLNRDVAENFCNKKRKRNKFTSHKVIQIDIDETNGGITQDV